MDLYSSGGGGGSPHPVTTEDIEWMKMRNKVTVIQWSARLIDSLRTHDVFSIADALTTYPSDPQKLLAENLRNLFWVLIFGETDLIITRHFIQLWADDLNHIKLPRSIFHPETEEILHLFQSYPDVFFDKKEIQLEGEFTYSRLRHHAEGYGRFMDDNRSVFVCGCIIAIVKYHEGVVTENSATVAVPPKPLFAHGFYPDPIPLIESALNSVIINYSMWRADNHIAPHQDRLGNSKIARIDQLCSCLRNYEGPVNFMLQYQATVERSTLEQQEDQRLTMHGLGNASPSTRNELDFFSAHHRH